MNENDRDFDMRDEYDFSQAQRGPILPLIAEAGKTRISIRIDNDILKWFRDQVRSGGNYQTLMNHALRDYMCKAQREAQHTGHGPEWTPAVGLVSTQSLPGPTQYSLHPSLQLSEILNEILRELVRQVVREELERAK